MDNKKKHLNSKKISQNVSIEENKENANDITHVQNQKIESLKLQLFHNQKKINDIELRKLANIENIKKNTKEKIENIKKMQIEKFLKKTIPLIDALEDILAFPDSLNVKIKSLIEGIELTLQSLLNILLKLGVKVEGKKNEPFNSKIHTPISIESSKKITPNSIISVVKKGFTFNEVLLRKAIVTISKN